MIKNQDVIDLLFNLFIFRGYRNTSATDNGPEFTARSIRKWLSRLGVKTLFIEPGSPWRMAISNHLTEGKGRAFKP